MRHFEWVLTTYDSTCDIIPICHVYKIYAQLFSGTRRQKFALNQCQLCHQNRHCWDCRCAGFSGTSLLAYVIIKFWAMTCDFQQCDILTNVESGKPVQPPLKRRNSKCCSASTLIVIQYSSVKQRLWSDCAYAQAGLSLCWSHNTTLLEISCCGSIYDTKSHELALSCFLWEIRN